MFNKSKVQNSRKITVTGCFLGLGIWGLMLGTSYPQGCNDAGFCTVGDMKPVQRTDSGRLNLIISEIIGLGEKQTWWFTSEAEINVKLFELGKAGLKIPYHLISGKIDNRNGPGDITLFYIQTLLHKSRWRAGITAALKIPVNDGGEERNGEPLPMPYQTSQGTWDMIAGFSFFLKTWHFSTAFQHNFNENGNGYLDTVAVAPSWTGYFPSRKIDRGDDVMIRVEKNVGKDKKVNYHLGLLPIYRMQRASILNLRNERIELENSSGLTLNVNMGLSLRLSKGGLMKFYAGFPALTRKVRPDGLTRSFSATVLLELPVE
ncbi:MAG: hypothetical protein HYY40_05555 [Bacteroidetes bacterium]|nr:hypothetical protein [Bacteroidota bacterium]